MTKKIEPGREAWMSDAGYKSFLQAQGNAPAIARTGDCRVALKCPHCQALAHVSFTAQTAPSDGFENEHVCETCHKAFVIDAVLDVVVRPV